VVEGEPYVSDVSEVVDSLAHVAWPVIVGYVALRIGPALRDVLRERDIKAKGGPGGLELEVGGQAVSTQQAVDDQRHETEAVRAELSLLSAQVLSLTSRLGTDDASLLELPTSVSAQGRRASALITEATPALVRRVLWVDDQPANNAYELAALRDRGVDIVEALSTEQALRRLGAQPEFDAIVTDMHRIERGHVRRQAGLELLRELQAEHPGVPAIVYTSFRSASEFAEEVRALGGVAATANATELFELLGLNFGPRLAVRLESEVFQILAGAGFANIDEEPAIGMDFVAERAGLRIGVEVKAWHLPVDPRALDGVVTRLAGFVARGDVDEAWLVTAAPLDQGTRAPLHPKQVRVFTLEALRDELLAR
jgi:CheY-like chemotaxis protein